MELIFKNVKPSHYSFLADLAGKMGIKVEVKDIESPYDPDFVAKIKQGDEDIAAGRTVKISLDDIWK